MARVATLFSWFNMRSTSSERVVTRRMPRPGAISAMARRTSPATATGDPADCTSIVLMKCESSEAGGVPGIGCSNGKNAIGTGSSRGESYFVLDHTDDAEIASVALAADAEGCADRVATRQRSTDKLLRHDGHRCGIRGIMIVERTAEQNFRAQRPKVIR